MFHRFVFVSAAVLALLWGIASPGQVYAGHGHGGYGRGSYGYGYGRGAYGGYGYGRGSYGYGYRRAFFGPRFGRFERRFGGFDGDFDRFFFAPGFVGLGAPYYFGGF